MIKPASLHHEKVVSKLNWIVSAEESGTKLQAFIKGKLDVDISARQIKQSIDAGNCSINGKVERFSSRLVGRGDRIVFHQPSVAPRSPKSNVIPFDSLDRILYIDKELIIYDKPAGFSSEDPRLLKFIKSYETNQIAKSKSLAESETFLSSAQLVHRLDRDTTGILIFARNNVVAEAMFALFKQRHIKKTYLALVDGVPKNAHGVIDNYLGKISTYQGQTLYGEMSQEKGGLHAKTMWHRKKMSEEAAVIECHPETGRTHQLRVHLSGIGHPILGDYQYGRSFNCTYRPERMMLHAYEIAFENPVTKLSIKVVAKLPLDFLKAELHLFKSGLL